jgi:hypothetical protein
MTKHEFPPFNMVIENGRLVPATPYDQERLLSFTRGTKVKVRFTEEKDRILVRKWWAILGLVVKQCQTPWTTKEEASEAVKLALGIVNLTKTVQNNYLQYPKSLTELEDPELQEAVDNMTELLSRMTGVDVETLKKETAHIKPEPEEPHDPETGELTEQPNPDDAPLTSPAGDASSPPAASSEPSDTPSPRSEGSTIPEPSLFGKFEFSHGEVAYLKELAVKALDDAASDNDLPAKEAAIERLYLNYADVIESQGGREAMTAMGKSIAAVVNGKRSRSQAADYIARELIGCASEELEGRRS